MQFPTPDYFASELISGSWGMIAEAQRIEDSTRRLGPVAWSHSIGASARVFIAGYFIVQRKSVK